jgi:hypothetical protein
VSVALPLPDGVHDALADAVEVPDPDALADAVEVSDPDALLLALKETDRDAVPVSDADAPGVRDGLMEAVPVPVVVAVAVAVALLVAVPDAVTDWLALVVHEADPVAVPVADGVRVTVPVALGVGRNASHAGDQRTVRTLWPAAKAMNTSAVPSPLELSTCKPMGPRMVALSALVPSPPSLQLPVPANACITSPGNVMRHTRQVSTSAMTTL